MIHLLDSHVLVWMMLAPEKLGKKTRGATRKLAVTTRN